MPRFLPRSLSGDWDRRLEKIQRICHPKVQKAVKAQKVVRVQKAVRVRKTILHKTKNDGYGNLAKRRSSIVTGVKLYFLLIPAMKTKMTLHSRKPQTTHQTELTRGILCNKLSKSLKRCHRRHQKNPKRLHQSAVVPSELSLKTRNLFRS